MNELQIFNNEELQLKVRAIQNDDGSISINAEDTAIGFGWSRVENKNGKEYHSIMWSRMNGFLKEIGFAHSCAKGDYIPESLFYRLGMKANNAVADKFQNWLAMEVIPSIRKHGGYIGGQESLSDDELLAKALVVAQNKIAERDRVIAKKQERIDEMRPKEIFADAVTCSNTSILVGDLAKLLKQNGFHVGQNRLFEILRREGFLIKGGSSKNMPTQKSMEMRLFEIKESTVTNPDGSIRTTKTPKVTGRGQVYFINKFIKEKSR